MKTLFIGLVLGSIAVWSWYHTGGKIYITETKTITNEVVVTITETQLIERVVAVTRTNEVWKTNIVEITRQPRVVTKKKPVVKVKPKKSRPAPKKLQPAPKKATSGKWSLSRPRRSSSVKPNSAVPPPAGGGLMYNDGQGRSYRIVNGRRVYY